MVLSLAKDVLPILGQLWLLTTGPLTSVTVLFAKFCQGAIRQEYPRATARFLVRLHFSNGHYHRNGIPLSSLFWIFFFEEGASITQASAGEQRVDCIFSPF